MTSALIAHLGMYDGGDLARANDELWIQVAERLRARGFAGVPDDLERQLPVDATWNDRLLFGQSCGYPFISRLSGTLQVVGAPVYDVPGCDGATHRSFVVVPFASSARRLEDLFGARAIINEPDSNTGWNLFGDALHGPLRDALHGPRSLRDALHGPRSLRDAPAIEKARFPFFSDVVASGSHLQSLIAIAEGKADAAAIDCISYAHFLRADPRLETQTRILHVTRASPTLPYVTARQNDAIALFSALTEALTDPKTHAARRTLRLLRVERIDPRAYEITHEFAAHAADVFGPTRKDL